MSSTPPPSTATVPVGIAPSCAAASMPRASPETITRPPWPSSAASPRANRWPAAEATRAPTMATQGRSSSSTRPRVQISGGGGSRAASACGKAGSQEASSRAPSAAPSASSLSTWASAGSFSPAARPPRRARSGRAASALAAVPNRWMSWSKVTGPTFSVRASLSQSRRSASDSSRVTPCRPQHSWTRRSAAPRPSAGGGCWAGAGCRSAPP